jgi:hypothetical protein
VNLFDPGAGLLVDVGTAGGRIRDDDMRAHDDTYVIAPGQTLHVPASTWGSLPPTPVCDPAPPSGTGGMSGFETYLMTNAIIVTTVSGANTVSGGAFLPNGLNDGLHTGSGKLLAGGVLANDAPQIPPLYGNVVGFIMAEAVNCGTAAVPSLVEGPAHGTLTLGADGSSTILPDRGFTGIDRSAHKAAGIPSSALGSADAQALIHVVPLIDGGAAPTLDLLALSVGQQVATTYLAFFGRDADADGFEFWVGQFQAGQATQTPATLFFSSLTWQAAS